MTAVRPPAPGVPHPPTPAVPHPPTPGVPHPLQGVVRSAPIEDAPAPWPGVAVALVGGLDPTGMAGLARDIAVCAGMGIHPCPVPTCTTVQTTGRFDGVEPVPALHVAAMLDAAWREWRPAWMKVGAVAAASQAEAVAAFARRTGTRIVLDPVLGATAGGAFCTPADLRPLLEIATVITPNQAEARQLGLSDGGRVHVTRGGPHPGVHRGTGCRFATMLACLLASGLDVVEATASAHRELGTQVALDAAAQRLDASRRRHLLATQQAVHAVLARLSCRDVPEVGINLAWAMAGASDAGRDVCGLAGRITIAGTHHAVAGRVAFGGPHHTGRIALAVMGHPGPGRRRAGDAVLVMNHRLDPACLEAARRHGIQDVGFDRTHEPPDAPSSMEWGVLSCIRANGGRVPDLVWDEGGPGKEPMVRIIAPDLHSLLATLDALHNDPTAQVPGAATQAPSVQVACDPR